MYTLNCKGRLLLISEPLVMGIINITPDSFFSESRRQSVGDIVQQAGYMLSEGAAILDIGGQSTRPNSIQVGAEEEGERIAPAIAAIKKQFPEAIISVDTYNASVARIGVEAGATIVNDIGGGRMDEAMLDTVASLRVPYICMHMKGRPGDMPKSPHYENLMTDLIDYFVEGAAAAQKAGITDLVIDPGFGFGKTYAHNFEIVHKLALLKILGKPILLGVSRKSTIYKNLGVTPEEALNGTTVLHTAGLLNGAAILRVHDVKPAVEAIRLVSLLAGASSMHVH